MALKIQPSSICWTSPSQCSMHFSGVCTWWEGQHATGLHCLGAYFSMISWDFGIGNANLKLFSFFSCLAYAVHVSLPYSRVLMMQALYTVILVFSVSFVFSQTWVVSLPSVDTVFWCTCSFQHPRRGCHLLWIPGMWTGRQLPAHSFH